MHSRNTNNVQDADSLVGLYFVSFEFGDLCWRGRITSRKGNRYNVAIEPATWFALTGVGGVLMDGEKVKHTSVRISATDDWRFFKTPGERDTFAAMYLEGGKQ